MGQAGRALRLAVGIGRGSSETITLRVERDRTGSLLCPELARVSDHSRPMNMKGRERARAESWRQAHAKDVVLRTLTSPNGPSSGQLLSHA